MSMGRTSLSLVIALSLTACGGGGSGGGGGTFGNAPTPTPSTSACTLSSRQDFAKAVIDEWYLFPSLVDNTVSKASHSTVQSYIDALVAPARVQSRDRFFTYITSIAEENAFINSGSSAGFGIRLAYDTSQNRVFVVESFEGAPALAAGIDRGTEIVAIGTSASNLQSVASLMASGGSSAVSNALGPSDAGVTRVLEIVNGSTRTTVTVTKTNFALDPVSNRYGAQILNDGGKRVGYINLRTFIDTADADLRSAFATFKSQGVTEVIVDVRYNGGGLVRIAELFGELMAADRVGQVFSYTTFRDSKASNNSTDLVMAQPQAIAATKIAFIGYGGTASASELVANSFIPYLGTNTALIGSNTFGKPVGQIAIDKAECDDRMRVVAFRTENSNRQGDYYTGLASVFPRTCRATDDISKQLGDPNEVAIKTALDFLAGRACTPIAGVSGQGTLSVQPSRELIYPAAPSAAQRDTPGLF
ncbi:putative CtpA-like serine protease [Tsuneonella dongtanensis]|uniref:Putative CtpA-like serine protease n=1 Tax=Tsuneonella dongtanensis TaxID=692370 RepID=A0A1B2ADD1_9SPHN|nr:S41 family peptidase [Tsuneonella dongtanensis]ANY20159.1 putative CtpA-like serine protease [Tsuneonella dongtanensis]